MSNRDIAGYQYAVEHWCVDCIIKAISGVHPSVIGWVYDVEGVLDVIAGVKGINRYDENTFDSEEFPKVILTTQVEDDERCSSCNERLW